MIVRLNAYHKDRHALNPVHGGKGVNKIQWFIGRRYRRQTVIRCLEAGGDDADRPFAQKYDKWCVSKVLRFEVWVRICSFRAILLGQSSCMDADGKRLQKQVVSFVTFDPPGVSGFSNNKGLNEVMFWLHRFHDVQGFPISSFNNKQKGSMRAELVICWGSGVLESRSEKAMGASDKKLDADVWK